MLRSIGDVALLHNTTAGRVDHVVRTRNIPHAQRAGGTRLFDDEAVGRIGRELAAMPRAGRPKLSAGPATDTLEGNA